MLFEIENGEALFDCLRFGDLDGDNLISCDEFIACAIDFNVNTSAGDLKKAFDIFDTNDSGDICKEEMKELLKGISDNDQNFRITH